MMLNRFYRQPGRASTIQKTKGGEPVRIAQLSKHSSCGINIHTVEIITYISMSTIVLELSNNKFYYQIQH